MLAAMRFGLIAFSLLVSLVWNARADVVYATDYINRILYRIDPDGSITSIPSPSTTSSYGGVVFDPEGNLYVGRPSVNLFPSFPFFANMFGSIDKIAPDGTVATFYSAAPGPPTFGMALSGSTLYFSSGLYQSYGLFRVDSPTVASGLLGTYNGVTEGLLAGPGVAIAPDGTIYSSSPINHGIYRLSPNGVIDIVGGQFGSLNPLGLLFDPTTSSLYAIEATTGSINRFDAQGQKTEFASGLPKAYGLAFGSGGNIFVAQSNGVVSLVSPEGSVSTYATLPTGVYSIAASSVPEASTVALVTLAAIGGYFITRIIRLQLL